MLNINFYGNLGADSELRNGKNGKQFLTFRVASNERVGGQEVTTWLNVVWSSESAPKMQEYLKKGKLVEVHGVLRTSTYKTKAGDSATSLDVFADRVNFISTGSGSTQSNDAVTASANDFGTLKPKADAPAVAAASSESDSSDDLPF